MSKRRKFQRGHRVNDPLEAVRLILHGEYLWVGDRPQHPGWMGSQMINTIRAHVRAGLVYRAELTPEWQAKNTEKAA